MLAQKVLLGHSVTEAEPVVVNDPAHSQLWQPRWTVDVGHGCKLGVTIDDGCFVVLYPTQTAQQWRPGTHIPMVVARFIGTMSKKL